MRSIWDPQHIKYSQQEAVREGKIRTHYNIETQKLRGNNLSCRVVIKIDLVLDVLRAMSFKLAHANRPEASRLRRAFNSWIVERDWVIEVSSANIVIKGEGVGGGGKIIKIRVGWACVSNTLRLLRGMTFRIIFNVVSTLPLVLPFYTEVF